MKMYEMDDQELSAKQKAIESLIDHIDDLLMSDRSNRKVAKNAPALPMEDGKVSNESLVRGVVDEDTTLDLNDTVRNMTQDADDEPLHDVEDPKVADELTDNMDSLVDERQKYQPRMNESSKGHMYVVNKQGARPGKAPAAPAQGRMKKITRL